MFGRIIKNLSFSGALVGLVGIVTGLMAFLNGWEFLASFCLVSSILLFAVSFLIAIYFHKKSIHVEPWGALLGLVTAAALFILECIFFSFIFGILVAVVTILIVFIYAFIARLIYRRKQKRER